MFSDSRTPAPEEQKAFKPHAPHFIPWLRNSLKPHHGSGLGLNGPYKSSSEVHNDLTPSGRPKGIGIFSFQGKDKSKKGEIRCNGVGMARMLPVVLRGHHILPGGLGKSKQPPDAEPDTGAQALDTSSTSAHNNRAFGRNHSSNLNLGLLPNATPVKKYGPLVGPPAAPVPPLLAEGSECKLPVVVCTEDRRERLWDYTSHTIHHRGLRSDPQGLVDSQQGFGSNAGYKSRNSQSQRDLTALGEPPVEGFAGGLNGVIFSTEVPQRGLGFATTLRGRRKPRPSAKHMAPPGHKQAWGQARTHSDGEPRRKEACCDRTAVRNQIKRVVENLEQVLTALRDVHQEMREVVQQIDHLTASFDLDEQQQQQQQQQNGGGDRTKAPSECSSSSSGSGSTEGTVIGTDRSPSEHKDQPGAAGPLRRDGRTGGRSPVTSSERTPPLRFSCSLGHSPRNGGVLPPSVKSHKPTQVQNSAPHDSTSSHPRSLSVRPPTPGLSPLTVNLHRPSSPASQPPSPGASSSTVVSPDDPPSQKPPPPAALSPSVVTKTPQSQRPSAAPLCPSLTRLHASCPPTDSHTVSERRASPAGPVHRPSQAAAPGRRGRKPPPYPHQRLSEHTKAVKEPRKAPPYPEKRRLLSTTV